MQNSTPIIAKHDLERLEPILNGAYASESTDNPVAILRSELPHRRVIAPKSVPANVVTMNSRVRVLDIDSNEIETYTIVYPKDADVDSRKISVLTRLGVALLGSREGDIIEARTGALEWKLKILRVLYQPEADGRYDL